MDSEMTARSFLSKARNVFEADRLSVIAMGCDENRDFVPPLYRFC
jgi:hypothetical protein